VKDAFTRIQAIFRIIKSLICDQYATEEHSLQALFARKGARIKNSLDSGEHEIRAHNIWQSLARVVDDVLDDIRTHVIAHGAILIADFRTDR
jgi:hypothetical protein